MGEAHGSRISFLEKTISVCIVNNLEDDLIYRTKRCILSYFGGGFHLVWTHLWIFTCSLALIFFTSIYPRVNTASLAAC